jgi:hypothetical protein
MIEYELEGDFRENNGRNNYNPNNDSRITSSMNRYASANQLDYDVILRKNLQNEKLKQL